MKSICQGFCGTTTKYPVPAEAQPCGLTEGPLRSVFIKCLSVTSGHVLAPKLWALSSNFFIFTQQTGKEVGNLIYMT